nr:unnamed protein product [Callosobruchus chinensis]
MVCVSVVYCTVVVSNSTTQKIRLQQLQEVLLTIQPSPAIQAQISPSLEYCSHIWGAAAFTTLSILDAVQRRATRLICDPALTCHLQPLSHRCGVLLVTSHSSTCIQTDSAPPSLLDAPAELLLLTPRRSFFLIKNRTIRPHLCPQGVQSLE